MAEFVFLTQQLLATRWRLSTRTLEGWRVKGIGPRHVSIGNRVRYRVSDILAVERPS
jgi:hypothetical protein